MSLSALANRALLVKMIAAAISYGFTLLLAHTMTAEGFGTIALFLNLSIILSILGARGQQLAALRFVPALCERPNRIGLENYVSGAVRTTITGTLVTLALAAGVAWAFNATNWAPQIQWQFMLLGALLVVLVGWIDLQSHLARACNFLMLSLVPKEILWRSLTGVTVVAIFLTNGRATLTTAPVLISLIVSLATVAGLQAILTQQRTGIYNTIRSKPSMPPVWRSARRPFWVTSVSNVFLANADVVLVGLIAGPKAAGIYFAANRLAVFLSFPLISYNIALGPAIASAWQSGDRTQAAELIHQSTLKTTLPTVAIGAVFFLFAAELVGLFGPGFSGAALPLQILTVAAIINAASGPADIALNMCGFHHNAMRISAITLAISLISLIVGGISGGATGTALAVVLATFIRKFLFWHAARHHLALRTDILVPRRALPVAQTP
ncbi:MAG: oligosaccharide flippase family protein [Paracoccaceae bacterium]